MLVKHRSQQRLQGVITPIKDRKCSACRQEFKSKGGLISHQSRTTNPLCRRAGKIRMGSEWAKKAKNRFWEKKKVFENHVYVLSGRKFIKNAKNSQFGEILLS